MKIKFLEINFSNITADNIVNNTVKVVKILNT